MSGPTRRTPPPPRAGGVASPCTSVCRMDPSSGWCLGCARTLDEIAAWGTLDDNGRRGVLARLPERRRLQREARVAARSDAGGAGGSPTGS